MPLYHQIFLILRQQITDGFHEYDVLIQGETHNIWTPSQDAAMTAAE